MSVTGARSGRTPPGPSRLVRGAATLGGGRVVAAGLSAVWLVVAARRLSVGAFGDLSVLLAVGAVAAVLGDLGYPFLLSHAVARSGRVSASTLRYVVVRRLGVGLGAAAATAVLYLLVADDTRLVLPALYGVSLLSTVVYSSVAAALRGLHAYRVEALNEVISRSFVLAVGGALLAAGGGLVAAVGVYAVADLGSLVAITCIARRRVVAGEDGIDHHELGLRRNGHLGAGRVAAVLYYRADAWLMAFLRGSADAGLYAAPYRLLDGLLLVPRSIGAVVAPHLGPDAEASAIRRMIAGTVALAAALALPIAVFASPIVETLFGARYSSSAAVLAVLALSAIPGAVVVATFPLLSLRSGRASARLAGVALAVNVGLNLVVIPPFGPIGAASTTLVCQLVFAGATVRLLIGRSQSAPDARRLALVGETSGLR